MTDVAKLLARFRVLDREVTQAASKADLIRDQIQAAEARIEEATQERVTIGRAIQVLKTAAEVRRQELRDRVEGLITRGLRAVFERQDIQFVLETRQNMMATSIEPKLRTEFRGRIIETEILDGHGGGVADLVAFLLRVVVLTLSRPRVAPVMVLDESFRHVSPQYLRGVAVLLRELNRTAGVQFILVTHKPELLDAADVIYRATIRDGMTTFDLEHECLDDAYHAKPTRDGRERDNATAFDGRDIGGRVNDDDMNEIRFADPQDEHARRQQFKAKRPRKKTKNIL